MTGSYDELVTGTGAFRPHWRGLMEAWSALAPEQRAERLARVSAQIADADQILALPDPTTGPTARSLDLLPLIIPEQEWRVIAAGIEQRAHLLDRILGDLHGPQRLIGEHKLPPYLVLGNPAFLRPLRNVAPVAGAPHLYFYAADLVRLDSGEWRVFSDRTQAAAGVGYALHNRSVLARTLPEAFRAVRVSPLQPIVELWQASLRALGGKLDDPPLIVLLTPGPYNDAYFEHVYLARELGIVLVQNTDLTVRNSCVYLKTLGGLVKVDVIYRRVDGDYCDSLELREDSALGVAGLVEAARAGHVAILNMPGSAVVEAPALAPFLPELSRQLLSEELKLPAVTTWWCGQGSALAEVQAALDRFAVHGAFDPDPVPLDPALLTAEERERFEAQLTRHPERFVAREKMAPSLAPCFSVEEFRQDGARLVPKPVVVRVMALWHEGRWYALPGGVARVVSDHSIYRSALRHGSVAKDVWVLAGDSTEASVLPSLITPTRLVRGEGLALRSRTADDLYWLGRHVERLEAGARQFLAVLHRLTAGTMSARNQAELIRLAESLKRAGWISFTLAASPVDGLIFFDGIVEAASGGMAIRNSIDAIHRLAHAARDQLSIYMWQTLQRLTQRAVAGFAKAERTPDRLLEALDGTIASLAAFGGLVAENMARGAGWRFLDLGRRIERGVGTCQAIGGVMTGPLDQIDAGLRLSLDLFDSMSGYLRRFPLETNFMQALNFVLTDHNNPRSLLFQLEHIEHHLAGEAAHSHVAVEPSIIHALIGDVERSALDFGQADAEQASMQLDELLALLERTAGDLMVISDAITRVYFTHTAPPQLTGFSSRQIPAEAAT